MKKQNLITKKIKQIIKNLLKKRNIEVYRSVEKKEILEAISLTKPFDLGHPLIRIGGPTGDGGYLLPDVLDDIKYCFSPGVGLISEFETQLKKEELNLFLQIIQLMGQLPKIYSILRKNLLNPIIQKTL